MSQYTKPLPQPAKWSKPFWEGARQHRLLLRKCNVCGKIDHPPYMFCSNCMSEDHHWIEASGKGKLYTFTSTVFAAPLPFLADLPYIVAMVDLEEGARMLSNIVESEPGELEIGMEVEVVFEDVTENTSLPKFRPAKRG